MTKKVSAFEYAIAEAAGDKEFTKNHSPRTRKEEAEHRLNNMENQAKKLRLSHVDKSGTQD